MNIQQNILSLISSNLASLINVCTSEREIKIDSAWCTRVHAQKPPGAQRGSEAEEGCASIAYRDPAGARLLAVGDEDGGVGHRPVDAGTSPKNGHVRHGGLQK